MDFYIKQVFPSSHSPLLIVLVVTFPPTLGTEEKRKNHLFRKQQESTTCGVILVHERLVPHCFIPC